MLFRLEQLRYQVLVQLYALRLLVLVELLGRESNISAVELERCVEKVVAPDFLAITQFLNDLSISNMGLQQLL